MPRGDKTGPEGAGPMTGKKLGFCAGNENPGFYYDEIMNYAGNARVRFNRKHRHRSLFQRRKFWRVSPNDQKVKQYKNEEEIKLLQKRINDLEAKLK